VGRSLAEMMPDEPEGHGLVAMMLCDSTPASGRPLPRRRDRAVAGPGPRTLWDAEQIATGGPCSTRPSHERGAGRPSAGGDRLDCTPTSRAPGRRSPPYTASSRGSRARGRRAQPGGRDREAQGPEAALRVVDSLAALEDLPLTALQPGRSCCAAAASDGDEAREAYGGPMELVTRRCRAAALAAATG